jgi:2-oxoglutarate dehydrogenase E1 component
MAESSMEALWRSGHISGGNASYVETMFEDFLEDPEQCPGAVATILRKPVQRS